MTLRLSGRLAEAARRLCTRHARSLFADMSHSSGCRRRPRSIRGGSIVSAMRCGRPRELHHANIVPFYELGRDNDSHFYTMQLVDGISLAEVIDRLRQCRASEDGASRPCMNREADPAHPAFLRLCARCRCRFACCDVATPLDAAAATRPASEKTDLVASPAYHRAVAELVRDAALAVDYAHHQGILHLDLKPSNLLIDAQGKLWITDFGASRPGSGSDSMRADGVVGTLCYMSPEQAGKGRTTRLSQRRVFTRSDAV